jgi:NAD(P)-dependent dehydrogenase (short-subunit alcohol dehydrogenase family)
LQLVEFGRWMVGKHIEANCKSNMLPNKFSMKNKTAVITGGAGLLGLEHAAALIESGARIILTDRCKKSLHLAKSNLLSEFNDAQIINMVMDVSDQNQVIETFKSLQKRNIRIDVLINNAAVDPKVIGDEGIIESSRLEAFSLNQWNLQIAVGLTGAFICSQVFGTEMAKDGLGGVILNIASDLSVISPDQRLYRKDNLPEDMQPVKPVTYSVIKTGLIGLTRYLATYWADQNIRCNALSPGGVLNNQSDEFVKRLSLLVPLGRMAQKNEYRSAVQFLCSDASKYMNGQNLVIDGGRSVW